MRRPGSNSLSWRSRPIPGDRQLEKGDSPLKYPNGIRAVVVVVVVAGVVVVVALLMVLVLVLVKGPPVASSAEFTLFL